MNLSQSKNKDLSLTLIHSLQKRWQQDSNLEPSTLQEMMLTTRPELLDEIEL